MKCPLLSPQVSCPQTSTTARWRTLPTPTPWPSAGEVWGILLGAPGPALCSSPGSLQGWRLRGSCLALLTPLSLSPLFSQREEWGLPWLLQHFGAHLRLRGISLHSRVFPLAFHGMSVLLETPTAVMEAVTPAQSLPPVRPQQLFLQLLLSPLSFRCHLSLTQNLVPPPFQLKFCC